MRTAACGSATGSLVAMSRISMKETGIRPGPPSRPMGFATNHSGLDWAMTMMASPALASSSSGRSSLKSYRTMPYTMAPVPLLMLTARVWPGPPGRAPTLDSCRVWPARSEYPESGVLMALLVPEATELPLCRSAFLMTSKKETGTSPRALGINGLQASYHSGSSSRLMT